MTEEISKMKQVSLGSGNDTRCDDAHHSHITETQDTKRKGPFHSRFHPLTKPFFTTKGRSTCKAITLAYKQINFLRECTGGQKIFVGTPQYSLEFIQNNMISQLVLPPPGYKSVTCP